MFEFGTPTFGCVKGQEMKCNEHRSRLAGYFAAMMLALATCVVCALLLDANSRVAIATDRSVAIGVIALLLSSAWRIDQHFVRRLSLPGKSLASTGSLAP